jgi:hypothetical protein
MNINQTTERNMEEELVIRVTGRGPISKGNGEDQKADE